MLRYQTLCCDFCTSVIDPNNSRNHHDAVSGVTLCPQCLREYRELLRPDEPNIFCRPGEWNTAADARSCKYMTLVQNSLHDFHLLGVSYENRGVHLKEDGGLAFSRDDKDSELTLRFLGWSLKASPVFEIRFSGVVGYALTQGLGFPYEVSEATLSPIEFRPRCGDGPPLHYIALSIDGELDPSQPIEEQGIDCVVAHAVRWRWLDPKEE